jgi:hypothetical protein
MSFLATRQAQHNFLTAVISKLTALAAKLPTKLVTDFYTADDYLIELRA